MSAGPVGCGARRSAAAATSTPTVIRARSQRHAVWCAPCASAVVERQFISSNELAVSREGQRFLPGRLTSVVAGDRGRRRGRRDRRREQVAARGVDGLLGGRHRRRGGRAGLLGSLLLGTARCGESDHRDDGCAADTRRDPTSQTIRLHDVVPNYPRVAITWSSANRQAIPHAPGGSYISPIPKRVLVIETVPHRLR